MTSNVVGDIEPANDEQMVDVFNGARVTTFPYDEDFENGPRTWLAAGPSTEWELATPFDAVLFGANGGFRAWVTDANGNYANNADGWVEQLCGYDFTNLTNPVVQLAINYEAEFSWDGARLESSIDGGRDVAAGRRARRSRQLVQ